MTQVAESNNNLVPACGHASKSIIDFRRCCEEVPAILRVPSSLGSLKFALQKVATCKISTCPNMG